MSLGVDNFGIFKVHVDGIDRLTDQVNSPTSKTGVLSGILQLTPPALKILMPEPHIDRWDLDSPKFKTSATCGLENNCR